jgi:hypothetical protein
VDDPRKARRSPANVIEGNYKLMPGICPWWDGVLRGEAAE